MRCAVGDAGRDRSDPPASRLSAGCLASCLAPLRRDLPILPRRGSGPRVTMATAGAYLAHGVDLSYNQTRFRDSPALAHEGSFHADRRHAGRRHRRSRGAAGRRRLSHAGRMGAARALPDGVAVFGARKRLGRTLPARPGVAMPRWRTRSPRSSPYSWSHGPTRADAARSYCGRDIEVLELPIDDSWLRDSGPIFVMRPGGERAVADFRFNSWGEQVPALRHRRPDRRAPQRAFRRASGSPPRSCSRVGRSPSMARARWLPPRAACCTRAATPG